MDLNYKKIIEYLSDNNDKVNFPIKQNIMRYANYFENKFSKLLTNDFFMYGINIYDNLQNNISLWSSILFLVEKSFLTMNKNQQISFIDLINKQFIEFIKNNYKNFINKKKFSKNFAIDILKKKDFNPLILELISYCFNLNIIIFDFLDEKVKIINSDDVFNPWKSTILLGKYNDFWEPICNSKKLFNYSNSCIKEILNGELFYFESEYLDRDYTLVDNLNELYSQNKEQINDSESSEESQMFIKTNQLKLNKTKLRKMKKAEIINLINEFNYEINVNQNKTELIKCILMS